MFTIAEYVKVHDLEEAYVLNQKKTNVIIGGGLWLRLGKKRIQTAIDLSNLGLDEITENEKEFSVGSMATLRQLETHEGIHVYTKGAVKESLRYIVGVQMRNCATVGGSIYGRFGFSDILACLLGMDCEVELYNKGRLPLQEFVKMKKDNDILVQVHIKKTPLETVYLSQRNSSTDFPVVSCSVTKRESGFSAVIGARPSVPVVIADESQILQGNVTEETIADFAKYVQESVSFADNTRASGAYRRQIAGVLVKRGIKQLLGGETVCR